jgi:hypothetical protein
VASGNNLLPEHDFRLSEGSKTAGREGHKLFFHSIYLLGNNLGAKMANRRWHDFWRGVPAPRSFGSFLASG